MDERYVFFKNAIVPVSDAHVHALSPTAQFAVNVFEGIRGYWGEREQAILLFRLDEHLARLRESCRLMHLEMPFSDDETKDIIKRTIRSNGYSADIAVRLIVFIDGEGSWSTVEPASIIAAPINMDRKPANGRSPLRATVSSWRRIDDLSLPPRVKCGANYINGRYAQLDAQAKGFDIPLFLGADGKLSEAPGACLFVVKNGTLVTPPTTASILDSITRDTLLQLARENDLLTEVRPIDRTELMLADEAFLCGSSAEISPIGSVDDMALGNEIGPVTQQLSDRYFHAVSGIDPKRPEWTSRVDTHQLKACQ